jgi:hypothetical protein
MNAMTAAALILTFTTALALPAGSLDVAPGVTVHAPAAPVLNAPQVDPMMRPQLALAAGAAVLLSATAGAALGAVVTPLVAFVWSHPSAGRWQAVGLRLAQLAGRRAAQDSTPARAWAVALGVELTGGALQRVGGAVVGVLAGLMAPQGAAAPPQAVVVAMLPLAAFTVLSSATLLGDGLGTLVGAAGVVGNVSTVVAGHQE